MTTPAPTSADARHDVVVVGGGLIGLASAWRLAQRGLSVRLLDPAPAQAASRAAAGMLAPVTEVQYGEEPLLRLNLAAAGGYPDVVAELEAETGHDVGYRRCGTLAVALDSGDRAELDDLHAFQASLGLAVERLTAREARRLEPMLTPALRGGLWAADDHQVDNRRLAAALLAAATARGAVVDHRTAQALQHNAAGTVTGVVVHGGDLLAAGSVVVAAGPWTAALLPQVPVRPVKGQILRLLAPDAFLSRNVRAVAGARHVYLVPRADGELVLGASVEEMGFDTTVRAGQVHDLLHDAALLLPGLAELPLVETMAGLRPGSPDNAPIIGRLESHAVVATGHHRNGVLLSPITADAVAALVTGDPVPAAVAPFGPDRFGAVGAAR